VLLRFSVPSTPTPKPSKPPKNEYRVSSPGVKRSWRGANPIPRSSTEVKERVELQDFYPRLGFRGRLRGELRLTLIPYSHRISLSSGQDTCFVLGTFQAEILSRKSAIPTAVLVVVLSVSGHVSRQNLTLGQDRFLLHFFQ